MKAVLRQGLVRVGLLVHLRGGPTKTSVYLKELSIFKIGKKHKHTEAMCAAVHTAWRWEEDLGGWMA